jgi:hypothetical protein
LNEVDESRSPLHAFSEIGNISGYDKSIPVHVDNGALGDARNSSRKVVATSLIHIKAV